MVRCPGCKEALLIPINFAQSEPDDLTILKVNSQETPLVSKNLNNGNKEPGKASTDFLPEEDIKLLKHFDSKEISPQATTQATLPQEPEKDSEEAIIETNFIPEEDLELLEDPDQKEVSPQATTQASLPQESEKNSEKEVTDNENVPSFTRTQLFNVVSLLEGV